MAKCLVGANGGGKVTIEGLSADVVLDGSTITVKQGNKVLQNVTGNLSVLAFYGGNTESGVPSPAIYWNGKSYVSKSVKPSGSFTFSGKPLFMVYLRTNGNGFSISGTSYTNYSITTVDNIPGNDVYVGVGASTFVILGSK